MLKIISNNVFDNHSSVAIVKRIVRDNFGPEFNVVNESYMQNILMYSIIF